MRSGNEIGTTCKGIGPTYMDKYQRVGIRAIDLLNPNKLTKKINIRLSNAIKNNEIEKEDIDGLKEKLNLFYDTCDSIKEYIEDTFPILHSEKNILVEGAQGTLLDIDFGTYPYVTSSNCSSGGIGTGLGIPANKLDDIIGIFKAYTTRVGGGPFPTELFDNDGKNLGSIGKEFGATTGRPRRCGWFDLVAAKYSAQINGLTHIALTKLDILNTFETIKVCVGYKINNKEIKNMSAVINDMKELKPIYKQFKGWNCEIKNTENFSDLPENAIKYIEYLENELEVPISIVSLGPKRHQIINRNK